jgi:hypothetical protein
MLTLLITSVLILGLVIVAVYFWQKPASTSDLNELPPPPAPRGLFEEPVKVEQFKATLEDAVTRSEVFAQASAGDKKSLQKARELENEDLYDQALTTLVTGINSDAQLLSLVSYVLKNQWPVNKTLANAYIASWLKAPDKTSTTKTLHIAALSNDAETYRGAAELALKFWREGKLPDTTAIELNALLNGEFWVLSSATRNSGAGFVLKRSLASARRELEGTNTNN